MSFFDYERAYKTAKARIAELEAERDEMKRRVIERVRMELPDSPAAAERIIALLFGEGVT